MSRKITLISIAIIAIAGLTWASSGLLPNNSQFPSFPTNTGSIGWALKNWFNMLDGTAKNTAQLDGISASGYLQNSVCTTPGQVWLSVDARGVPQCGFKNYLLVGVWRGGTISVSGPVGTRSVSDGGSIQEGDVLSTGTQTGTLAFNDDNSILRLDTDTTVQISYGTLDGKSVAQAILENGQLWGRVLTSTGVNIGGGGLVAGVRGTSIVVKKTGTSVELAIIDSTNPTEAAKLMSGGTIVASLQAGDSYKDINIADTTEGTESSPGKTALLSDTWIKKNALTDIEYLAEKITATTDTTIKERIKKEIDSATPTDTLTLTKLLDTTDTTLATNIIEADAEDDELDGINLLPTEKSTRKAKRRTCNNDQTYIPTKNTCIEGKNIRGVSNFANQLFDIAGRSKKWDLLAAGGSKNQITSTGDYLIYNLTPQQKDSLNGKTITVTLSGSINQTGKYYIADFGGWKYYFNNGSPTIQRPSSTTTDGAITCNFNADTKNTTCSLTIGASVKPTQMVIGNSTILVNNKEYQYPIKTDILSISIQ